MLKMVRLLVTCAISAVLMSAIASAQTYTTVDYPGATTTVLAGGPNPQGTSVGFYIDTTGAQHGFTLNRSGVFTAFDPPGSTATTPNYITPQGTIVGGYVNASGVSQGFVLSGGQYQTIDFPGAAGTQLTGLNPSGEYTGFSCTDPACATPPFQSFTLSKQGVFTGFNPPGATSSTASTVNPAGAIVGSWTDSAGTTHGYLLYHSSYVTIDYPGSIFTFAGGNNANGAIVGAWRDTANVLHSFLLNRGVFTGFDPPGSTLSDATGINPEGIIVGFYVDSAGVAHGYIRTP
jgi:hypothetical protein